MAALTKRRVRRKPLTLRPAPLVPAVIGMGAE
jgi:hypothetical protein